MEKGRWVRGREGKLEKGQTEGMAVKELEQKRRGLGRSGGGREGKERVVKEMRNMGKTRRYSRKEKD